jgi:uncharacterized protein (UPF0303 family)
VPPDDREAAEARIEQARKQVSVVVGDDVAVPVTWREDGVIGALVVCGVPRDRTTAVAAEAVALVAIYDA